MKWNETRRILAIFACFYVARAWQRQLGFLVSVDCVENLILYFLNFVNCIFCVQASDLYGFCGRVTQTRIPMLTDFLFLVGIFFMLIFPITVTLYCVTSVAEKLVVWHTCHLRLVVAWNLNYKDVKELAFSVQKDRHCCLRCDVLTMTSAWEDLLCVISSLLTMQVASFMSSYWKHRHWWGIGFLYWHCVIVLGVCVEKEYQNAHTKNIEMKLFLKCICCHIHPWIIVRV